MAAEATIMWKLFRNVGEEAMRELHFDDAAVKRTFDQVAAQKEVLAMEALSVCWLLVLIHSNDFDDLMMSLMKLVFEEEEKRKRGIIEDILSESYSEEKYDCEIYKGLVQTLCTHADDLAVRHDIVLLGELNQKRLKTHGNLALEKKQKTAAHCYAMSCFKSWTSRKC